jgi:membrane protein DedA with SNARE-associated domain
VWNSVLVLSGYWLGDRWDVVGTYVGLLSKAVLVLALVALAAYVAVRLKGRRATARHRRDG